MIKTTINSLLIVSVLLTILFGLFDVDIHHDGVRFGRHNVVSLIIILWALIPYLILANIRHDSLPKQFNQKIYFLIVVINSFVGIIAILLFRIIWGSPYSFLIFLWLPFVQFLLSSLTLIIWAVVSRIRKPNK